MRKPIYKFPLWQKMLRKYRSIQVRIVQASDLLIIKRLERKLEILRKRIISTNRKWAIGIATAAILSWLSNPVFAQEQIDLDTSPRVETVVGGIFHDVGDFNGDGHMDVLMGNWETDSYLIFGDTNGLVTTDISQLDGTNGAVIKSSLYFKYKNYFKFVDINGDGKDDIVGAEGKIAYIMFGTDQAISDTLDIKNVGPGDGLKLTSSAAYSLGENIVPIDDINGDGINDLALFDYYQVYYTQHPAYILFGNKNGFPDVLNLDSISDGDGLIMYAPGGNYWGRENTIGDINGDGITDLIHNRSDFAQVEVFFGKADGFPTKDIPDWNAYLAQPGNGWVIKKDRFEAGFFGLNGFSVPGDVNLDGKDDIAIVGGEDYTGEEGPDANKSTLYIVYGQSNAEGILSVADIDGANGVEIALDARWAKIGIAGDINGDGIDDVSISKYAADTYVIYGSCTGMLHNNSLNHVLQNTGGLEFPEPSKLLTSNAIFDYNQDGFNDLALSTKNGQFKSDLNSKMYFVSSQSSGLSKCDFARLKGVVKEEGTNNVLSNAEIMIQDVGIFYSNQNGEFTARIPYAGNFDIFISSKYNFIDIQNNHINLDFNEFGAELDTTIHYTVNNFVEDYAIKINSGNRPRPGFDYNLTLEARNEGTFDTPLGVETTLDLPDNYTVTSISDGGVQTGNQIVWQVSVPPFGLQKLYVEGAFSADANLGDQAFLFATINAASDTDVDFDNNFDELETEIVGSYDPNDKTAADTITPESVQNGEFLEYLIRFQNTGTDTAFNVLVTDTLTENLQWNTFELLSTSHTANVSRVDSILRFQFDDILLVDSTRNELESHGYISFRIKPDTTLTDGEAIENEANIYFDFNAPVTTNNMVTQVQGPVGTTCTNPVDITADAVTNGWDTFNIDNASGSQYYSFTAAEDGYFRMNSCLNPGGTVHNTSLKVYKEDCDAIEGEVGGNCAGMSTYDGEILTGETYIFEWDNEEQGIFEARFYFYQPVTGIDCNDPVPLVEGLNTANYYLGPQYFSYTAEVPGTIHVSTCGLENNVWDIYDTKLYAFCNDVAPLAVSTECYDINEDVQMELTYHVDAGGSSYILELSEVGHWYSNYDFEFTFTPDCEVDEVTIDVSACDSYVFNGDTLYTSGTYFDIFTNQAGCDSLVTLNLTVDSVDVSVLVDGTTLTANEVGADSYQWLDCDNSFIAINGETNQSFTPGTDGDYAVKISSGSCVDTSSCYSITVTGVTENSFGEQLKVYPNPTNGKLNIQLGENYNNVSVALRNELGQVIAVDEYSSTDQIWLDIQGNAGVYFLNIHTENGQVATLKVLKD